MTTPVATPWAILLCRFTDDGNDPAVTTLADLFVQWRTRFGDAWLADNLTADAEHDSRTILELYQLFFTITGLFTFNLVRYVDEMSHGRVYIGDSRVFPCVLDLSVAQSVALADSYVAQFGWAGGGREYQADLFRRAKMALDQQHHVDWHNFAGVVLSLQNEDGGGQGYSSIDGGPGIFMGIKFLRNDGTMAWGHELGHGVGLSHSMRDGDPTDARDPWDIMSARRVSSAADPHYGGRGPGMNAGNMRALQWLDESRVWRGPVNGEFSEVVQLRPLHKRNLSGYLAAELPGTGSHNPYLVEFRVPDEWDAGIGYPCVIVHRNDSQQSYIMPGTNRNQSVLGPGGHMVSGTGPFSSVRVVDIDQAGLVATVQLCHSANAPVERAVQVVASAAGKGRSKTFCRPQHVEGAEATFTFSLSGSCLPAYTVSWSVTGASAQSDVLHTGRLFSVTLPPPSTEVAVTVTIVFSDGVTLTDTHTLRSISAEQAQWIEFLCTLREERKFPAPWWQWTPAMLREVAQAYSKSDLARIKQRVDGLAEILRALEKLRE